MSTSPVQTSRRTPLIALLALIVLPLGQAFADDDHDGNDGDHHGSKYSQCLNTTTPGTGTGTGTTTSTISTYRLAAMPSGHRAISEGEAMPAGHPRTSYGGPGTVFTLAAFPDAILVSGGTTSTTTAGTGTTTTGTTTAARPSYRQGQLQLPEIALDDDPNQRFSINLEWVPGSQPPLFRLKQATHLGK